MEQGDSIDRTASTSLQTHQHQHQHQPLSPSILKEKRVDIDSNNNNNNNNKQNLMKTTKKWREDISKLPKEIRNLFAGGVAGILAKSVVAPLDRIKILYQISSAQFHIYDLPKVAKNIIQKEGLVALWKGNSATMVRVFPYAGIQFMVFDRCKSWILHEQQRDYAAKKKLDPKVERPVWGLSPVESLVSGMIAGVLSVIATYPLDLTRAQLAVMKRSKDHSNQGFVAVLGDNYTKRGVFGLFRGITPTLLGVLPYSGIAFALNEQAKRKIQNLTHRDVTTVERIICGGFSGLVAQTVTYPLEVTRRRMQTIGVVAAAGDDAAANILGANGVAARIQQAPSIKSIAIDLYKEQGIRGFFKGVSLNWMKGPVAFSISFTVFDTVQGLIETESERRLKLPRKPTIPRDDDDVNQQ